MYYNKDNVVLMQYFGLIHLINYDNENAKKCFKTAIKKKVSHH